MDSKNEADRNRSIALLINSTLVGLAIAAWASTRFPEYLIPITLVATIVSIAACAIAFRIGNSNESLADMGSTAQAEGHSTVELTSDLERHAPTLRTALARSVAHDDPYWKTLQHLSRSKSFDLKGQQVGNFAITMNIVNLLIRDEELYKSRFERLREHDKIEYVLAPEEPVPEEQQSTVAS